MAGKCVCPNCGKTTQHQRGVPCLSLRCPNCGLRWRGPENATILKVPSMSETVEFRVIGTIRSEHTDPRATPIQPCFAKGCKGAIELLPEYEEGLKDIEEFSHLIVIYHLHRAGPPILTVKPFLEDAWHGVIATRHPCRPNPIGLSIVRLLGREKATLFIEDVDILDGTPLLDIKPFIPRFDCVENPSGGWTEDVDEETARRRGLRDFHGSEDPPSQPNKNV